MESILPSMDPTRIIAATPGILTPGLQYFDVPTATPLMPGLFPDYNMPFNGTGFPTQNQSALDISGVAAGIEWPQQTNSGKSIDDGLFTGIAKPVDTAPQENVLNAHPMVNEIPAVAEGSVFNAHPAANVLPAALGDDDDDMEMENVLSINLLLEFQPIAPTFAGQHPATWENLGVTMVVVKKSHDYQNPSFPFQTAFDPPEGIEKPIIHIADESTEIPRDGMATSIMQKSIDIPMPNLDECPEGNTFFDINLVFKDCSANPTEWLITTSCYIALQSAKKVLYPIRCNFARHRVDVTGAKPTFYCSFAVKRTKRSPDTLMEQIRESPYVPALMQEELLHMFPKRETVSNELSSNPSNDSGDSNGTEAEMGVPDKATLKECTSHGMRPIGPRGRLMTSEQRRTFASIQKRFAKTPCRERKSVLLNTDLYPLFTLGRDECCKEMGTCATWLKHRMRERGIKVWPNRRLIPTTSGLYRLKQQRAAIHRGSAGFDANSPLSLPHGDKNKKLLALDAEIEKLREIRMDIVRECCTPSFFAEFQENARPTILDPDWEK